MPSADYCLSQIQQSNYGTAELLEGVGNQQLKGSGDTSISIFRDILPKNTHLHEWMKLSEGILMSPFLKWPVDCNLYRDSISKNDRVLDAVGSSLGMPITKFTDSTTGGMLGRIQMWRERRGDFSFIRPQTIHLMCDLWDEALRMSVERNSKTYWWSSNDWAASGYSPTVLKIDHNV